jgi:hypothetical protein
LRARRSVFDPFLARPLSCLVLFGGYVPVGSLAQVAIRGIPASAMPSTKPIENAGFSICERWTLLGVIAGNWARIGHGHVITS